ncbi:MAG: hypothetical protein ACJ758_01535 [Actinomycetota bacterium]
MRQQLVSEFRKLWTTWTAWGLLIALLAVTAMGVVGVLLGKGPVPGLPFLNVPMGIAWAFVLILGLRSFTDEFRHGSIVPTLLADPDRRRVLFAKVSVTAGAAVVFALAAAALSFAIGLAWFAVKGYPISIGVGSVGVWLVKLLLIDVLWSAIGVGVGLAVRHQVAAIAGTLVAVLVGENILAGFVPAIEKVLPGAASSSLAGLEGAPFGPVAGAAILAAWTIAFLTTGSVLMERRDVA